MQHLDLIPENTGSSTENTDSSNSKIAAAPHQTNYGFAALISAFVSIEVLCVLGAAGVFGNETSDSAGRGIYIAVGLTILFTGAVMTYCRSNGVPISLSECYNARNRNTHFSSNTTTEASIGSALGNDLKTPLIESPAINL